MRSEARSAAERQKICSPWREDDNAKANQPRQGRNPRVDVVSSFAALRLARWPQPIPTADAVGYRSFAAPRLCLMTLKTPNLDQSFLRLSWLLLVLRRTKKSV